MRQSLLRIAMSLAIGFVLLAVTLNPWSPRVHAQSPHTITANDPDFTTRIGDQMNWPAAWSFILNRETSTGPNFPEVDAVVLDTGVDSNHPDLAGQCRTDLFENVSGDGLPALDTSTALHGTAMAGNLDALTNNDQFVASAPGLIPGRVKIVSIKWNDGVTGNPDNARQGLIDTAALVARGVNIRLVSFSSEEPDNNPAATQAVLQILRNLGVVVLSPPLGMVGSYAGDDRFSVVSVMELDNTGQAPELNSDGQPFGNLAVAGGGPVNELDAMFLPWGTGSGLGTNNPSGVSSSTSWAAGCLAALIQWGPEKDPLRALRLLELTATMFPGLQGHSDFGRIDLYNALAASINLPPPPTVDSVRWNGGKKIIIRGSGFGPNPGVIINGVDVTPLIKKAKDGFIKIKGPVSALAIKPQTANTIVVNGGVGIGASAPMTANL